MRMELIIRFDYGSIVPWVRQIKGSLVATAGPDTLELDTKVATRGEGLTTLADFTVAQGERVPFTLNYHPSFDASVRGLDADKALAQTQKSWRKWSGAAR